MIAERKYQVFGAWDTGSGELRFAVSAAADILPGDLIVIVAQQQGGFFIADAIPDGFLEHEEDASSTRCVQVFSKIADGEELGTTLAIDTGGALSSGVLIVYRGPTMQSPVVQQEGTVDPISCMQRTSVTVHTATGVHLSQATDRVIVITTFLSTVVTVTEPVASGFTSFGQVTDAALGGKVTAGELVPEAVNTAGTAGTSVTANTSANCASYTATVALRMAAIAAPVGLTDPEPCSIGLSGS